MLNVNGLRVYSHASIDFSVQSACMHSIASKLRTTIHLFRMDAEVPMEGLLLGQGPNLGKLALSPRQACTFMERFNSESWITINEQFNSEAGIMILFCQLLLESRWFMVSLQGCQKSAAKCLGIC